MSEVKVNKISPRTNCGTVQLGDSGDTITIPAGATITNNGTQTGFGRTGTVDWNTTAKTADFTAVNGEGYFINTAGGAVIVTLPGSPSGGNIVSVSDYNGTASTNAITIARNGSNINGDAANYVITKGDSAVTLVYVDGTVGWTSVQTSSVTDNVNAFVKATGGTETESGDFKIHTFTGPGTFTVTNGGTAAGSNTVGYMIVGGGAGGGGCMGGGGGAGGFRESKVAADTYSTSPLNSTGGVGVTAQAYPIVVGAGGAGGSGTAGAGSCGVASSALGVSSAGGGGGGAQGPVSNSHNPPGGNDAKNGGSGGGQRAGYSPSFSPVGGTGNTPPVSPPQGNNGGKGYDGLAVTTNGGGGGGAGAAGSDSVAPPSPAGGVGGAGVSTEITGSAVTRAGGGGGGSDSGSDAAGGSGGGGTASPSTPTSNGTVNTGGGGGGHGSPGGTGGAGGSGIVVIRYKFQ